MIRAGLSGTNWTGKSTCIDGFSNAHRDRKIEIIRLTDFVSRCPYPTVENQTPEASRWMIDQVKDQLTAPSDAAIQLYDRSPLDILAFTQYAFDRSGTVQDDAMMSEIVELAGRFGAIFFCSISSAWPLGDRQSPKDVSFALLMDWYMRRLARRHKLPVVELPDSPKERERTLNERLFA